MAIGYGEMEVHLHLQVAALVLLISLAHLEPLGLLVAAITLIALVGTLDHKAQLDLHIPQHLQPSLSLE